MKKRYEARGMMEWHPLLSAGKTRIRIPFTGGHLSGYGVTSASFETADPVVQAVIERSRYFKTGQIRPAASIGDPESCFLPASDLDCGPNAVRTSAPAPAPVVRKRFASLGEASDWLSAETGVPSARLLTEAQCVKEAAAHGFSIEIAPSADKKKGGAS